MRTYLNKRISKEKHIFSRIRPGVVLLACLLFTVIMAGCAKPASEGKEGDGNNAARQENKTNIASQSSPQYYFVNGTLLGSFDREGWHSLCELSQNDTAAGAGETFTAKDLLEQGAYYVYDIKEQKTLGVSREIVWSTGEEGLGSFGVKAAAKTLAKYGELYQPVEGDVSLPRIFKLPVKGGEDLAHLKIPTFSFFTRFIIDNQAEYQVENTLASNQKMKPFPDKVTAGLEATDQGFQAMGILLKEKQMENTEPRFSSCVQCDFDKDNKMEYLMIANTPRSESGYPVLGGSGKTDHLGVFTALLYQDDQGSIQTLYSDLRPYKGEGKIDPQQQTELMYPDYCISMDLFSIADLNDDGVYEIIVRKNGWEFGYYLTYAMNSKGQYELAMRSNYGM